MFFKLFTGSNISSIITWLGLHICISCLFLKNLTLRHWERQFVLGTFQSTFWRICAFCEKPLVEGLGLDVALCKHVRKVKNWFWAWRCS
jgi:hypothetical protein